MGEDYIPLPLDAPKNQKYMNILDSLQWRLEQKVHPVSNRANFLSLLKEQFKWWWIGFYFIYKNGEDQFLTLGSFQGPPACTKIFKQQGVCGKCWSVNKTIIVPNVEEFQGHIACSSQSKSEIVVPVQHKGQFIGLLDIDSEKIGEFDQKDQQYLEKMIKILQDIGGFNDWVLKQ